MTYGKTNEVPQLPQSELTLSEQFEQAQNDSKQKIKGLQESVIATQKLDSELDLQNYKQFKTKSSDKAQAMQELLEYLNSCELVLDETLLVVNGCLVSQLDE